ncbi:hypothetical protein BDV06DRAFT_226147 [Aspergillus oleicola]
MLHPGDTYHSSDGEHGFDVFVNKPFEHKKSENEHGSEGEQETEMLMARRRLKKTPACKPNPPLKNDDIVLSRQLYILPGSDEKNGSAKDVDNGMPPPLRLSAAKVKAKLGGKLQKAPDESGKAKDESAVLQSARPSSNDSLMDEIARSMDRNISEMNYSIPEPTTEKTAGTGKTNGKTKGKKTGAGKSSVDQPKESSDAATSKEPEAEKPVPLSPATPRSSVAAMTAKMNKDSAGVLPFRLTLNCSTSSIPKALKTNHPSGLQKPKVPDNSDSRRPSLAPSVDDKTLETPAESSKPGPKPTNLPNWGEQHPVQIPVPPKVSSEEPKEPAGPKELLINASKNEKQEPNALPAAVTASPAPKQVPENKPLPKKDKDSKPSPAPSSNSSKEPPTKSITTTVLEGDAAPEAPQALKSKTKDSKPVLDKVRAPTPNVASSIRSSEMSPQKPVQAVSLKESKLAVTAPLKPALTRKTQPMPEIGTGKMVSTASQKSTSVSNQSLPVLPSASHAASPSCASGPSTSGEPLSPEYEPEAIDDQRRHRDLPRRKSVSFDEGKSHSQPKPKTSATSTRTRPSPLDYKRTMVDKDYLKRKRRANSHETDEGFETVHGECRGSEDWCGDCQRKSSKVSMAVPEQYLDCDPGTFLVILECVMWGRTNDAGDIAASLSKRISSFTHTNVPVHAVVRRSATSTHRSGRWYDVTTKEESTSGSAKLMKGSQKGTLLDESFFWKWTMNREKRQGIQRHEDRRLRDFRLLLDLPVLVETGGPIEREIVETLPSTVTFAEGADQTPFIRTDFQP